MMHFGSPDKWVDFIDSQMSQILELVVVTWDEMPSPAGNELEDTVSESLCRALRKSRNRCDLPFRIDTQLVELDPAAGQDQGRLDIVFSPMCPREDIYFALECKRLHVRGSDGVRPYYAEYVRFGMLRYVRGQYASAVRNGGMLAFVMDGDTSTAVVGVESNIRASLHDLGMDAPGGFHESMRRPGDSRVRETYHRRNGQVPFVIQHLFMAGNPNTPLRSATTVSRPRSVKKKAARRSPRKMQG
jgi:hypothetical protein